MIVLALPEPRLSAWRPACPFAFGGIGFRGRASEPPKNANTMHRTESRQQNAETPRAPQPIRLSPPGSAPCLSLWFFFSPRPGRDSSPVPSPRLCSSRKRPTPLRHDGKGRWTRRAVRAAALPNWSRRRFHAFFPGAAFEVKGGADRFGAERTGLQPRGRWVGPARLLAAGPGELFFAADFQPWRKLC